MLGAQASVISDDGSTTSEMSGHDSESIYETIRVFTPKKQGKLILRMFTSSLCFVFVSSTLIGR
jgi:hypothetical protein